MKLQPNFILRVCLVLTLSMGMYLTSSFAQNKGVKSVTDYTSIAKVTSTADGQNTTYTNPYTSSSQTTFAGTFNGTLNSQAVKFYCIDLQHSLQYNVDYWDEGSTPPKITYILNNYFPYKTSYAGKLSNNNQEAAAIQMAIWHFADNLNANTITDATVKTRTLAIISDANANYNANEYLETILIIPPAQSFVQGTVASFNVYTTDIDGDPTPNVPVTLTTTLGSLSATSVTTNSSGHAGPITLTYSGLGTATVTAKANVTIPQGTRYVHKTSPGTKQKLVLATPSFDEKKVTATITWYQQPGPGDCDTRGFTTFTQGGWGSPSNSTPGKIRDMYFSSVFPSGLTVGGTKKLTLTSAQAVEDYLPDGGTAAAYTQNYTNPTTNINVLSGQLTALKLNVYFDAAGKIGSNSVNLGDLQIVSGPFANYKVTDFLAFAEQAIGGGSLNGFTYSQINDAATAINENFVDGTVDKGFLKCYEECKSKIGDFVWHDKDVDGIQDSGEPGIQGVIVELLNSSGGLITTTTTDANGKYEFSNLANGTYKVRVASSNYASGGKLFSTAQTKWYATKKDKGSDDSKDSDANKDEAVTVTINCNNNLTIDFGFYKTCISITKTANKQTAKPGEVITYTFVVENCGDIQHHGGVDVYDAMLGMNPYHINILNPGTSTTFTKTYTVKTTDCGNLVNTVKAVGHPVDGSAKVEFSATATVAIDCKASLGDKVWHDIDKDGIQDSGEPGVANVTVKLYDCSDVLKGTTTTDANGNYLFANLDPGSYYVQFILPSGYVFTLKDVGSNDAIDSDADLTTGKTICTTLTAGENDITWDAGIYKDDCKNTIGDFVWHDKDVDGIQDTGEPGIQGVVVELLNSAGTTVLATTTTDANGKYEFANLSNGTYKVRIAASNYASGGVLFSTAQTKWYATKKNQGSDDTKDSDANKDEAVTVTLNCNNNLTIDFGFYKTCVSVIKTADKQTAKPGEVITYTFTVSNCGDIALTGGVDFYDALLNPTAPHKIHNITPVNPGETKTFTRTYTVKTTDCGDLVNTVKAVGHPANGTADVEFTSSVTTVINCKASLGDKVWHDIDKDGIQDSGEPGVANVTVKLYDCSDVLKSTTTTDANGNYLFANLDPGNYYVQFILPSGYVFTLKDVGSNDAIDSDADLTTGKTICTTLTAGENDLTWDAGIYKEDCKNTIGDYVWHDKNTNGIQDSSEPGIQGVVVELLQGSTVIATTTTNASGLYQFTNVLNGTYTVRIAASNFTGSGVLAGSASLKWFITFKDKGTDDTKDSDGDLTTKSASVTVNCQNNPTIDFGFFKVCVSLIKTGPASVNVGEVITYTFTVSNCGDVPLSSGALVYDPMLNPNGDNLIKYLDIAPGQSATFTYEYQTTQNNCGQLTNNAWVIGYPYLLNYNFGGATVRYDDSHTVNVLCLPKKADLEVKKTASKSPVQCGETFFYTITVKNLGPDKSEGIVISDILPAGAIYQSNTPSQGTYDPNTGLWNVGDLNSGATATLKIYVKADCDQVNNSVFDLGPAKDYNLFVIKDVDQPSSDTQGKAAVGRDAKFANYSIGDQLPPNSGDVLIVGRHLTFLSGAVNNGNVVYGNTTNLPIPGVSVSGTISQGNPIDFNAAEAYLNNLSSALSAYAVNGTTTFQWGGLTLTGTDPFLNVFQVSGANLSSANNMSITVPNGSVVLVNIDGAAINWTGGLTVNGTAIGNVLYNFYQATSMTIQGIDIRGSVLAPKANINFVAGVINGQMICKFLYGMGQMNLAPFIGNIPSEKEVTNIASVHSVITKDPNPNNNSGSVTVLFTSGSTGGGNNGNGWQEVNGFGAGEIVYSLIYNGNTMYAGTWGGKIYRSTNNGQTWVRINNSMTVSFIWSLQASGGFIFAATEQGVYKYNGTTWTLTSLAGMDVHALTASGSAIYAGTWGFGVYKSVDAGATWTPINNGLSYFLTIQSLTVKGTTLFCGTVGGGVFRSTDGGANWTQFNVGNNVIWALGATSGAVFASSYGDGLYRSTDNGASWSKLSLAVQFVYSIATSSTKIYVASWTGGVFSSTDHGNTWTSLGMGGLGVSTLVINPNSEDIFVGTKEGQVFFSRSGSGATNVDDENVINKFELSQNYPNPFNPSTTIQFVVPDAGKYILKVYNMLGQEVATLVDNDLSSGIHKVNFDANNLSSGIYVYKLVGNKVNLSKKMILMK
jgi:choice-of-anchor A domain-containing protein/uncharacterized repeat protein (TIGR01451 family)